MKKLTKQVLSLERPSAVMTVALPAAGKTTIAHALLRELAVVAPDVPAGIVCSDDIRTEMAFETGSRPYDRSMNAAVFEAAQQRTQAILEIGGIAIIDATHLNRFRPETIERYRDFGAETVAALVLDVSIERAKQQNEARFLTGVGYVDPADMDRMEAYRQAHPLTVESPGEFDVVFQHNPYGV